MKKTLLLLIVPLLLLVANARAEIQQLKIGISTGYPPFYFFTDDGKPTGICIDILNEVTRQMGISVTYTSYPWQRMLFYGEFGTVDAIMPLFRTPEREKFLIFPQTDLIKEDNSFFTAASSSNDYSGQLADVTDKKIVVMEGFSYGPEFDQTEFKNKIVVKKNENLIKLVQSGRADFGIGNSKVITYTATRINAADSIRFLAPPVTIEPLHIGFSKKNITPDFVARFTTHLEKLKASATYQQIITSYEKLQSNNVE